MKHIFKCEMCNIYTMKDKCPKCNSKTINPKPAKYSMEDKFGKWRRIARLEST